MITLSSNLTEGKERFNPGEAINGTLRLKVNKELKLRGVRIEFHGKAHVHWSESHGSVENSVSYTHLTLPTKRIV